MKIHEALDSCSLALLREIARRRGVRVTATTLRRELVSLLSKALLVGEAGSASATLIEEPARATLWEVVSSGGCTSGGRLRRRLEFAYGVEPKTADRLFHELASEGWLFRTFQAQGGERGEWLCVPEELWVYLPARSSEAIARPRGTDIHGQSYCAEPLLDVVALADLFQKTQGRVDADQLRELERVHPPLPESGPAEDRWRFLTRLMLRLRWCTRKGDRVEPTTSLADALERPSTALTTLLRAYAGQDGWDVRPSASSHTWTAGSAGRFKVAVADALSELEPGWFHLLELCTWVARRLPLVLRSSAEARALDAAATSPGQAADSVEGVVKHIVSGPLAWLGVVEWHTVPGRGSLVRARHDRIDMLRGFAPQSADATNEMGIDDGGRITVLSNSALRHLLAVSRYTERTGILEWRLSRSSFARGVAAGGDPADASAQITSLSCGATEQWNTRLEQWTSLARAVTLRPALFLDLSDSPEREAILGDESVRATLERVLGDSAAVVHPEAAPKLRDRLIERGIAVDRSEPKALRVGHSGILSQREIGFIVIALEQFQASRRARRTHEIAALLERLRAAASADKVEGVNAQKSTAAARRRSGWRSLRRRS